MNPDETGSVLVARAVRVNACGGPPTADISGAISEAGLAYDSALGVTAFGVFTVGAALFFPGDFAIGQFPLV
jgi:hypothetical protein